MMRQTTTKAPGPPRESCTTQGATRRGFHASRLGSNGRHCKASIFADRSCSKRIVCKFTICKAVRSSLGLSSSVVFRPRSFRTAPEMTVLHATLFLHEQSLMVNSLPCWPFDANQGAWNPLPVVFPLRATFVGGYRTLGHPVTFVTAGAEFQQVMTHNAMHLCIYIRWPYLTRPWP